eukprot:c8555_g1_i2.p1 GENE.c8555_g1_i2~~c8555_g1_i2.p1  ORF type:complete len:324 (+),score=76.43 c8555_g1_i2:43-972(+)
MATIPKPETVNIILIGDTEVGKSSILLRFADDGFNPSFITTIGIDFKVKTVEIYGKPVKVRVWDTAGQDRFRNITASHYRGANGIFFVFEITNERALENIMSWVHHAQQHSSDSIIKALVCNKVDLSMKRVVHYDNAQQVADVLGAKYFQLSGRSGMGIEEAFTETVRAVIDQRMEKKAADNTAVPPKPAPIAVKEPPRSCWSMCRGSKTHPKKTTANPSQQEHQSPQPTSSSTITPLLLSQPQGDHVPAAQRGVSAEWAHQFYLHCLRKLEITGPTPLLTTRVSLSFVRFGTARAPWCSNCIPFTRMG